jgi:hypothetical protein
MGQPVAFFEVISPDHERAQKFYRAGSVGLGAGLAPRGGFPLAQTIAGEDHGFPAESVSELRRQRPAGA